jgi:hypothetical protein
MTEEQSTQVIEWNVNDQAIAEVAEQCKEIDAYQDLDAAKKAKKGLTKMRTALAEAHKETKAEALAFGRKVDAEKNRLLALIRKIEDPITEQLDEIKNKAAREEEERVQTLMNEIERIQAYALDRHSLTLEELNERLENLRAQEPASCIVLSIDMEGQRWVDDWDLAKEEADMKLRITIQNEKERLEEEAKQAEIAAENKRVADELAERQRKMDEEDAERQAIRDKEDAERKAREDAEAAERKRKQDIIDEQQRKAQKKIDEENERLAREKREREEEEERKNLEAEAEARALEQAPDRVKLLAFADSVDDLLKNKPSLATDVAAEVLQQATAMLVEVSYDIRKMTEEMK